MHYTAWIPTFVLSAVVVVAQPSGKDRASPWPYGLDDKNLPQKRLGTGVSDSERTRAGSVPQGTQEAAKVSPESFDPLSSQGFSDLQKKAAAGDPAAQYELGARYAEGIGVKGDAAKGYEWLRKAAQRGESRAKRRVGEMLIAGKGAAPNAKEGLEWLTKAAAAGDAQAQKDLALAYYQGTIVAQDYAKAFEFFLKLAQRGEAAAQRSLGTLYAQGKGVAEDLKAAREWWEKAAAQNEPQALYNLAMLHLREKGGEADSKAAVGFLVRAAACGDPDAQVYLGMFHGTGAGLPKDTRRAMDLIEAAARAGSSQAQSILAEALATGRLGVRDLEKARAWLARAAAQGVAAAQGDLGIFYQQGVGGAQDSVEALKWFHLAADQGVREAVARRKEISLFMEPAQQQEARRRADQFKPTPPGPVADDGAPATCPLGEQFQIPVRVFGQTNYLVVDTGATFTVLDITNQGRLGEPLARGNVVEMFGMKEYALYSCPEIFIGERRFAPLWTSCANFEKIRMIADGPVDGILGMSCLEHYAICFDPDKNRFSLGGAVPEAIKKNALAVPLKRVPSHNNFVIEITVNGVGPLYFELDTGDNGWLSLSERDWQKVFPHGEPKSTQTYAAALGDQIHKQKLVRVQSLAMGTNSYTNLIASLAAHAELPSRLGQGFIRRHLCAVDFPNQMLYLVPGAHFGEADEENMSGMYVLRAAEKTVACFVVEGSPAFQAGIRQEDQIISINGQTTASLKMHAIRELLRARPGARVTVEIKRGETTRHVEFTLKRAI